MNTLAGHRFYIPPPSHQEIDSRAREYAGDNRDVYAGDIRSARAELGAAWRRRQMALLREALAAPMGLADLQYAVGILSYVLADDWEPT